jgi:nitrite reductase/ring-hydroxylating ferredoxin subunit
MKNMQKLFPSSELPDGERRVVQVGARKVIVLNVQDEIFAVDNACPHLRFPLSDGKVTDDCGIICPFHHSAFDLKTGDVKEWSPWPPGLGRVLGSIAREKALPVYDTKIEDGYLWVSTHPRR